jgi:hypothetical protein
MKYLAATLSTGLQVPNAVLLPASPQLQSAILLNFKVYITNILNYLE